MLSAQLPTHAVSAGDPTPAAIQTLRGRYRPLLLFAPSDTTPAYLTQVKILTEQAAGLAERDIVFVPLLNDSQDRTPAQTPAETPLKRLMLTPLAAREARQQFHIGRNSFTVILIGKDGGEKLREHAPLSFERLTGVIDAMPMRQQEMRDRR